MSKSRAVSSSHGWKEERQGCVCKFKKVDIYKTVLLERRSQVNIYQRDLTIELLNIDQCCYVRSLAYKRDDIIIR